MSMCGLLVTGLLAMRESDMAEISSRTILKIKEIARANLGSANVEDFLLKRTTDVEGNPALQITIVLISESFAASMPKDAALNNLVQIHDELLKNDDQRFPFIRYATKEDLQPSVDDEL